MKRWLIVALFWSVTACSTQPPPTPIPNLEPTKSAISTVVPFPTLLPTVTTNVAQVITTPFAAPPTVEPTKTRAPVKSPNPAPKYPAPNPISPKAGDRFNDGNDIKFVYSAVGALKPNECYLLHIELVNRSIQAGNRGDDFVDTDHCADAGPAGKNLEFVLFRGKFTNSPNYGTILQQVVALAPNARELKMTWTVRVVQNNGRASDGVHFQTVALSPNSPLNEFEFQP